MFPTVVLVGLDGSPGASRALDVAVELCAATGSELHLGHIKLTSHLSEGARDLPPARADQLRHEGGDLLEQQRRRLADHGVTIAGTHVRGGHRVDRSLARLHDELNAGLLVVGSGGGSGVSGRIVGSKDNGASLGAVLVVG
jgi:nucleotide-binding universal stress UspA family protein